MEEQSNDSIALPSPEVLQRIRSKQDEKAFEIKEKRKQQKATDERDDAAKVIQKNYRGYKVRRELEGYGLDPSTRWTEV